MISVKVLIPIFFIMNGVMCESEISKENSYGGEKFPKKYLIPEKYDTSIEDIDTCLINLATVVSFFAAEPNTTDINVSTAVFFMKGIIRRVLIDDINKLNRYQIEAALHIYSAGAKILSHHRYASMLYIQKYGKVDSEYRLLQLYRDDSEEILTHSLPDFSENRLKPWILSRGHINEYVEDIDAATLPKDKYAEIVQESGSLYYIPILTSDKCLSRVGNNFPPKPQNKEMHACQPDRFCKSNIHASPSVAYSLSHRFLNMFMYRSLRRCYWVSPKDDEIHMDILCSFMYREAVYIARKGFFARDMFLEHVALCGMMGYKELYRQNWFQKVMQWIDADGCIQEDPNYMRNVTVTKLKWADDESAQKRIRKRLRNNIKKQCHTHPMAVLTIFLSNAFRDAARRSIYYFKNSK